MFGLTEIRQINAAAEARWRREEQVAVTTADLEAQLNELQPFEVVTVADQGLLLFRGSRKVQRHRFHLRIPLLRKLADLDTRTCSQCQEDFFGHAYPRASRWHVADDERGPLRLDYYQSPFDEGEPNRRAYFCSRECEQSFVDEEVSTCDVCYRNIENSLGYRGHFLLRDDEMVCVACWQENTLAKGLSDEEIDQSIGDVGPITADFFNESDLLRAGYHHVHGQNHEYHVPGPGFTQLVKDIERLYWPKRRRLIINLTRSGMGLEGYVELWAARAPN